VTRMHRRREIIVAAVLFAFAGLVGVVASVLSSGSGTQSTSSAILQTLNTPDDLVSIVDYDVSTYVDPQTSRAFIRNETNGTLDVVDMRTGALARRLTIDPDAPARVELGIDRIYVIWNGAIQILDARTQQLLRTVPADADLYAEVVDAPSGHVFFAGDNGVEMLNIHSGTLLRTIPLHNNDAYHLAVDSRTGHVFAFGKDGVVTMLDARSGRIARSVKVRGAVFDSYVDEQAGWLIVRHENNKGSITGVEHIDTRTGKVLSYADMVRAQGKERPLCASIVGEEASQFFCSMSISDLMALDPRSGALLYRVKVSPWTRFVLDRRDSRVLLVDARAGIGILDARTGAVLHTNPATASNVADETIALDEQRHRAFVLDNNANVTEVDMLTGATVRTIHLNSVEDFVVSVALDERTGHVLVVDEEVEADNRDPYGWIPPNVRHWVPFLPSPISGTHEVSETTTTLDPAR